jgi:intracellular multiplication protein IcmK
MKNRLLKKLVIAIACLSFSGLQSALAEEPVPVAGEPVTSSISGDLPEAQQWVNEDAQMQPNKQMITTTSTTRTTEQMTNQSNAGMDMPRDRQGMMNGSEASDSAVISKPLSYRRSQSIMLSSAPPGGNPSTADSNDAFNSLMKQNIPLTPRQVIKLRQLIDNSQRAAAIPATVPPKPVSTTLMMNLAPGATPPAIRLAQGYVTSLVFVDSTGAPWPIASFDIGDPKTSRIQWDGKSNVLLIQAISPYADSDLVIRLVGLMTPITLELVSGQRVVDFRTDIHVSGLGPNAKELPSGTGLPSSANQFLLEVLDGVGPPGSRLLTVNGGDAQAWLFGDKMYVRTRLTVLSPGWVGRMVSPDGMYAYEIQKSASILVSQYGTPIELKIEGF